MGTYFNPGNNRFIQVLNSDIYVDKTDLILELNSVIGTEQKYICVSRPRRFGKSVTASMISAYYDKSVDSRMLFENRKIVQKASNFRNEKKAKWDKYLGKFDVLKLVITDFMKKKGKRLSASEFLENIQDKVCRDIVKYNTDISYYDKDDLIQTTEDFYQETGKQLVIIIDEWDAVFREYKDDYEGQKAYLDFLRDWLKDKEYVALAYMTGILPIKKYGKHSALNMFNEYSMVAPLQFAEYTGFTEDEVKKLCLDYGRNFDEIKIWYDGYSLTDAIPPDPGYELQRINGEALKPKKWALYSPLSVVNAITTGINQNYWNQTETYAALSEYIERNYDGLREDVALLMAGKRLKAYLGNYQNDMTTFGSKDDIFALLIHLGYLGYDYDKSEVFIPNKEVMDEFKASTNNSEWSYLFMALDNSQKLLEATWNLNESEVARLIEAAHDRTGNKTYNGEAALSYAIQLAYYSAQNYYTLIQEMDTGKGYADLVYLPSPKFPDKPALLIELKYDKSKDTAIDQIKRQRYPDNLEHYKGNIILVGINYDKDVTNNSESYKHHSCVIERA